MRSQNKIQRTAGATHEHEVVGQFYRDMTGAQLVRKWESLPKSGRASDTQMPYSGFWYPESDGGTDIRAAGQSALALYDAAFNNGEPLAQRWEKRNHAEGDRNDPKSAWFGHCNGFASASLRHAHPEKSVRRNGQLFQPHHIRALLAEIYMSRHGVSLGGLDCRSPRDSFAKRAHERDPLAMDRMSPCQNVNPGTLHLMLGNWIGTLQQPFLFDREIGTEKWNYPMYAYEVLEEKNISSAAEANRLLNADGSSYPFNPQAVAWQYVVTEISYADARKAVQPNLQSFLSQPVVEAYKNYAYLLELDGQGNILGGEWLRTQGPTRNDKGARVQGLIDSPNDHPDYLWIAQAPQDADVNSDQRQFNNPHVRVAEVLSLWRESVSNPDQRKTYSEPISSSSWGQFSEFSLVLDGSRKGVAFLGKPIQLLVERRGKLSGESINLTCLLNGGEVFRGSLNAGSSWQNSLKPTPGLNRLELIWAVSGEEAVREELVFHAFP